MPHENSESGEQDYKKYTRQARIGIKGEAFFESLICEYSIPHHVVGPKDVGIDYFCEWTFGDRPSGVLYAVQVKSFSSNTARPTLVETDFRLSRLDKYEIRNSHLKVDERTLRYWRSLGIPVYLFAVVEADDGHLVGYYKRFTQALTSGDGEVENSYSSDYFRVSEGTSFLAFAGDGQGGFARDLFIDHVRCAYRRGSISYPDPQTFGLKHFPADGVFVDILPEYIDKVVAAHAKTTAFLKLITDSTGEP